MKIQKESVCGTLQSNDCTIRLTPAESCQVSLDSPVAYEFGDQIQELVKKVLQEEEVENASVAIEDRGALDCTIEARLRTAIRRAQ